MRPDFDTGDGGNVTGPGTLRYWTMPVRDLAGTKAFYGGVFGWQFEEQGDTYAHVRDSNPACGLMIGDGKAPEVWFKTLDIQTSVAKARSLGGSAEEPSESASGWSGSCKDDQGIRFNLWQPAAGQG